MPDETKTDNESFSVEKEVVVVTDAFLSKEVYGTFEGFKFTCPVCRVDAIMVNEDMGRVCLHCLTEVIVKSQTVDKFKKRLADHKEKIRE